jgi:hypothetical protein
MITSTPQSSRRASPGMTTSSGHDCYGRDCAEDRSLYRAYRRAINGDLPRPGPAARPPAAPPLAPVRARA